MPTNDDPATWIPRLIHDNWGLAKESLRVDAYRPVNISLDRQEILPAANPRTGGNLSHRLRLKVFQESDEATGSVTHGDFDIDSTVRWAISIKATDKVGAARRKVHEAGLIVQRVLQLFREKPHPDWHTVNNVRLQHVQDFADKQVRIVTFTLQRYGEVQPEVVRRFVD